MAVAAVARALHVLVASTWVCGDRALECTSGEIGDCSGDGAGDESVLLLQTKLTKLKATHAEQSLENLQWLHIPKAGTSFIATLWNFGCGQGDVYLDLDVDAVAGPKCRSCYDFALMDRYPKDMYCRPEVFNKAFETQHQPVTLAQITGGTRVVGFFRPPNHRVASAFNDGMHASGMSLETHMQMASECGRNVTCFAQFPGIAGCATRMLTGDLCAKDSDLVDEERIAQAIETVHNLAFVGLTENWDESICLFHLMFGSRLNPAELKDYHPSRLAESDIDKEVQELSGIVDKADEAVYAAARDRYNLFLSQHVQKGRSACNALLERDGEKSFQVSGISCKSANAECGPVGNKLDCGVCPPSRLGFLGEEASNTRPSCSEDGKCVVNDESLDGLFNWEVPLKFRDI